MSILTKILGILAGGLAFVAMFFRLQAEKAENKLADVSIKAAKRAQERQSKVNDKLRKSTDEGEKRVKENKYSLDSDD